MVFIRYENKGLRWTEEEKNFLKTHYPTVPTVELAQALGRSPSSVQTKAHALNIFKIQRIVGDNERYCPHCKQVLPKTKFSKNRWKSSGVETYCRTCRSQRLREQKIQLFIKTKEVNKNVISKISSRGNN